MEREDGADRQPVGGDAFTRVSERLAAVRRRRVVLACLAGVLVIAAVDPLLSMSALYLLPVLVAAARDTRTGAVCRCDALTGLLTTRAFYDAVEAARRTSVRTGRPVTLAYLDVDDVTSVNDRFGHAAGDEVLRSLAGVLRSPPADVDVMVTAADDAMYGQKRAGKNGVRVVAR